MNSVSLTARGGPRLRQGDVEWPRRHRDLVILAMSGPDYDQLELEAAVAGFGFMPSGFWSGYLEGGYE